jgi:3-methylfumaryl-CoA hydratase
MNIDIEHLRQWIGKSESRSDLAGATPPQALAATLDREDPAPQAGDVLPPCWHWLYFLPLHRQAEIGPDGHPRRGGFLPPVPLPRRMWAASRLEFIRPVRIGATLTRRSCVADVSLKDGRSGPLVFVRVRHEVADELGAALVEEQDIVYRDHPPAGERTSAGKPAPEHAWMREIRPDPVLLFRFSALTFNGHRIHYDRRYASEVEGYPGLVVQGPRVATQLLEQLRRERPDARLSRFAFRALEPLYDTAAFFVCGRGDGDTVALWARDGEGHVAMEATATLARPEDPPC